jgi:hypothetical protein
LSLLWPIRYIQFCLIVANAIVMCSSSTQSPKRLDHLSCRSRPVESDRFKLVRDKRSIVDRLPPINGTAPSVIAFPKSLSMRSALFSSITAHRSPFPAPNLLYTVSTARNSTALYSWDVARNGPRHRSPYAGEKGFGTIEADVLYHLLPSLQARNRFVGRLPKMVTIGPSESPLRNAPNGIPRPWRVFRGPMPNPEAQSKLDE